MPSPTPPEHVQQLHEGRQRRRWHGGRCRRKRLCAHKACWAAAQNATPSTTRPQRRHDPWVMGDEGVKKCSSGARTALRLPRLARHRSLASHGPLAAVRPALCALAPPPLRPLPPTPRFRGRRSQLPEKV